MEIEQLEQLAAVIVTAGLVAGNFLLFTPWRDGQDPRQHHPESLLIHQHARSEQTAHLNPDTHAHKKADSKRETERITI